MSRMALSSHLTRRSLLVATAAATAAAQIWAAVDACPFVCFAASHSGPGEPRLDGRRVDSQQRRRRCLTAIPRRR